MTEVQQDLVLHLLREGNWQEATLAYAEETGVTPTEAAQAVASLAKSNHIQRQTVGWLAVAALASFVSLTAGWLIARPF